MKPVVFSASAREKERRQVAKLRLQVPLPFSSPLTPAQINKSNHRHGCLVHRLLSSGLPAAPLSSSVRSTSCSMQGKNVDTSVLDPLLSVLVQVPAF